MAEEDYLLALELQKEFNREFEDERNEDVIPVETKSNKQAPKRKWSNDLDRDLNSTCNLVHPEWETLDPTPDVQSMFLAFDNKFFQGRLKCVTLEWSKRMYSCAGICYSRKCRLGMSITVRLSEPLLKLRPRKDLVETLLHEMIHAYCFVLNIREGNGGHGPYFKKIMYGINKVAGTNITVYHTFNDEVDLYKVHWWRCNGICQNRKPFFGFVKRSSNRAPGSNDFWWQQHVESCGGSFLKIKGPEPTRKKSIKKIEEQSNNKNDLTNYFSKTSNDSFNKPTNGFGMKNNNNNGSKGPIKTNGGGTLLLNPKTNIPTPPIKSLISSTPTKPSTIGGNLNNVISFKDLGDSDSPRNQNQTPPKYEMNGKGYSLNGNSTFTNQNDGTVDLTKLRDIWSKKYNSPSKNPISTTEPIVIGTPIKDDAKPIKRRRISTNKEWKNVNGDNDLIVLDQKPELICLSSDDESDYIPANTSSKTSDNYIKPTQEERQTQIKKEIIDYTDFLEDDIELIDDEYDDLLNTTTELADTSLVDDLFGEDTLLKDFRNENSVIPSCSRYHNDPSNDIVTCPICQGKIKRENFEEHLDGCVGISIKINPKRNPNQLSKKDEEKNKALKFAEVLKRAGYSEEDILKVINDEFIPLNRTENSSNSSIVTNINSVVNVSGGDNVPLEEPLMQECPVCAKRFILDEINDHLDTCLQDYQP